MSSYADETTIVFVPHRAIFPELPDNFAEFKRLLQSLSRTDAIFWCARLNTLISDTTKNPTHTQGACMGVFLSPIEFYRVNVFALQYGGASTVRVFFRGQLLELLRWTALFSSDHADDGATFDEENNRRTFVRAALIASDIWQRRVYRNRFDGELRVDQLRASALPSIRLMSMETAPTPTPFFDLARGVSLFADRLRTHSPDVDSAFQQATGLSLADYFSMLAQVTADGLGKSPEGLRDPLKCGIFSGQKHTRMLTNPWARLQRPFLPESRRALTNFELLCGVI